MQAQHGVTRYGQPIEGHPRWSTPQGQAELAAAQAAQAAGGDTRWTGDGAQSGQDHGAGNGAGFDSSSAAGGAV
jgi:hypothetical protein